MKIYSLTAAGKKTTFKKGTHAAVALEALKALDGKATTKQLITYVEEKKLLKTSMAVADAITWVVGYLHRQEVLKASKAK